MKKKQGYISIIVPIYGVEKYISECISSLCNQTYKKLEILLIDDGSVDNSGKICDIWAEKDNRIRVFHIENGGQSHARNVGLKYASGEYIGFVDGDDSIAPNMYECLLAAMLENHCQIAECNFTGRKSKEADCIEEHAVVICSGTEALARQLDQRVCSRYPATSLWSKLFRAAIIKGMELPEGRIHEEYAFLCEAFLKCKSYVYVNEKLYYRTLRKDSTTAEPFSERAFDKLEVFRMRNDILRKYGEEVLLKLSEAWEYELMLNLFGRAHMHGLIDKKNIIKNEMIEQRRKIMLSTLSIRKKLQYALFFAWSELYLTIYKSKNMQ